MKGKIALEVLGHRIRPFLSLERYGTGVIRLTTSDDLQRAGKVKICLIREEKVTSLKELVIQDIPPAKAGIPNIDVAGKFEPGKPITIYIKINGQAYKKTEVAVSAVREKRRALWIVPLVAILLFVLIFFPLRAYYRGRTEEGYESGQSDLNGSSVTESVLDDSKDSSSVTEDAIDTRASEAGLAGVPSDDTYPNDNELSVMQATGTEATQTYLQTRRAESMQSLESVESTASGEEIEEKLPVLWVEEKIATVYFYPESHILTSGAKQVLKDTLHLLEEKPSRPVTIAGHCALYDDEASREILSRLRAESVYNFLLEIGWKASKAPKIIGYGGKNPATVDRQKEHLNRRVEIIH